MESTINIDRVESICLNLNPNSQDESSAVSRSGMEPNHELARVCNVDTLQGSQVMSRSKGPWTSVEDFYEATYPRLVATVAMVRCSHEEAEELVQEAFVRLLPRWERVKAYEDPEGWVRSVALRLATSRWRRTRTAAIGALRLRPAAVSPPPNEDGILVREMLINLTPPSREVLVLHYGLGMRVSEMAQTLGIPEGTVKSRLARARDAARLSIHFNMEDYND